MHLAWHAYSRGHGNIRCACGCVCVRSHLSRLNMCCGCELSMARTIIIWEIRTIYESNSLWLARLSKHIACEMRAIKTLSSSRTNTYFDVCNDTCNTYLFLGNTRWRLPGLPLCWCRQSPVCVSRSRGRLAFCTDRPPNDQSSFRLWADHKCLVCSA